MSYKHKGDSHGHSTPPDEMGQDETQCDFCFDLFLVFHLFFSFSFVLVFIIF